MVNLRIAANMLTRTINPNVSATVRICTGYQDAPGARRTPTYADPVPVTIQIQALTRRDVEHLSSLNISNAVWSCYSNLQLTPVDRKTQTGGDLVKFADPVSGSLDTWLVVALLEGWSTAGWCRVALVKQLDAANGG
jgi:hypothetical protein